MKKATALLLFAVLAASLSGLMLGQHDASARNAASGRATPNLRWPLLSATDYVQDGFSGSSGSISGRTPPDTRGTAAWVLRADAASVWALNGTGQVRDTAAIPSDAYAYISAGVGISDASVSAVLTNFTGKYSCGIMGRLSAGADAFPLQWTYFLLVVHDTPDLQLVLHDSNGYNLITNVSRTTVANDVFKLTFSGQSITAYVNGTQMATTTSGTNQGSVLYGLFDSTADGVSACQCTFDNFRVTVP